VLLCFSGVRLILQVLDPNEPVAEFPKADLGGQAEDNADKNNGHSFCLLMQTSVTFSGSQAGKSQR
jgi:hypothetical protein